MSNERIIRAASPYTLTNPVRMQALYDTVKRISNIEGDLVETGVYKGGSSMLMAMTLKSMGIKDRKIYMYDTFEGMPEPTEHDNKVLGLCNGIKKYNRRKEQNKTWNYAAYDEVLDNMAKCGYPMENIILVKGKVEDTIPGTMPEKIALLRLDTDFYESTRHSLIHLFPEVVKDGAVVIDDYNCWEGSKKAVNEYFYKQMIDKRKLKQIDSSCVEYRKEML